MAGYGYAYNWGFIHPGFGSLTLVPRPPRPGVVKVAVILTYLGVGLSLTYTVISIISLFVNRDLITSQVNEGLRVDPQVSVDLVTVTHAAVWFGAVASVIEWILPAAGAVVCAILTGRGANPARIVLASLMGFSALVNLCGGTFALVSMGAGSTAGQQLTVPTSILRVVLAVLAVTIGVLLLVPSASRYFSAGPGRRFAPST